MNQDTDDPMLSALTRLLEDSHIAAPDQVPAALAAACRELRWSVALYLSDYEQRRLVPIPTPGAESREPLGIDSSLAGVAFQRVRPMHGSDEPLRVWVPLVDGVERLGVIEVMLPPGSDPDAADVQHRLRLVSLLTAHLVAVKMPYGDGLDRHRRTRPRTVEAELLWQLLPPFTFGCPNLVVSGVLEPCYDVAGDAFDYSVTDQTAYLLVVDSTGHDLTSGALTATALAAARKVRREGHGLVATVELLDATISKHFGDERFATGILGKLDLATGELQYVNAGHPAPLLMRDGRVVKSLDRGRQPMFGLGGYDEITVAREQLERGDRVVFYSDGVTEARGADGGFFGLDRLIDTLTRGAAADQRAPETLRRVMHDVLGHQDGVLQDDATLLIAEWASGSEHQLFPV